MNRAPILECAALSALSACEDIYSRLKSGDESPHSKMGWPLFVMRTFEEIPNMSQLDRFRETLNSYRTHGWKLRRVLMCAETAETARPDELEFEGIEPEVTSVDALWFARPSHAGREAWELRLIGETPYALFEAFEAECDDELREETLREMQARLIAYATRT